MVGLRRAEESMTDYVMRFRYNTGTWRTDGRTDRRTELRYQYGASARWGWMKCVLLYRVTVIRDRLGIRILL